MSHWQTLAEEASLLSAAASGSLLVELEQIGESVEGNPINAVRIGDPPPPLTDRADVLFVGSQHGNEPAGREALLRLVEDLGDAGPKLDLPGASGDHASTPDDASLDITGDIDLRIDLELDDWTPGATIYLLSKYDSSGDHRAYALRITSDGRLEIAWSTDGTVGAVSSPESTVVIPASDGDRLSLRATLDVDDGSGGWEARFYTADSIDTPDEDWDPLGDPVDNSGGGTTSIADTDAALTIGGGSDGTLGTVTGRVYSAEVYDGIDGTLVASPHFGRVPPGDTSFTDAAGLDWSVLSNAEIVFDDIGAPLSTIQDRHILIVPTANPDGIDADQRRNANDVDLNRDWLELSQPETRPIAAVLGSARPRVVLDQHESQNNIDEDNHVEFRGAQHPMAYDGINGLSGELETRLIATATGNSWDAAPYLGGGENLLITQLDAHVNLRHSVTQLIETNFGSGGPASESDRETIHRETIEDVLDWLTSNYTEITDTTSAAAIAATDAGNAATAPFVLRGTSNLDPPPVSYTLSVGQAESFAFHADAFNIDGGTDVSMGQSAYPLIPVLLHPTSVDQVVSATAVFAGDEPEPGEPGTGLAQVATAVIRTRLTWLACNLSDGAVITELPDLQGDEVKRVIGEYTSANLSLPIPAVGGRDLTLAQRAALAIQSTQPPRTKIVAVVNDVPAWEGIPLPRDLGTDAAIPLGCVSMEGYLRHVYITDHTFNGQDVALIADGILRDAVTTPHGPGIALTIDAPTIGAIASRSYLDIDDQTVYSGLSELMDAGLIEWTLQPDWRMGMAYRIVDTIARVRGQLGSGGDPQAVFQSATFSSQGASDARYQLKEDYGDDRYANVVRLRGAGQGEDQPRSAPAINQGALDSGVPVWELRDSAPRNVTEQALLDLHAERRLDRVRDGAHTLEITARWDAPGARLGVDWELGDLVRHELRGHAHPSGLNGVKRAIGFALSIERGTIRPILQEEA